MDVTERRAEVEELWASAPTVAWIGDRLGLTEGQVRRIARSAGLPQRPRGGPSRLVVLARCAFCPVKDDLYRCLCSTSACQDHAYMTTVGVLCERCFHSLDAEDAVEDW